MASAYFPRAFVVALPQNGCETCFVYLRDIIIYANTIGEDVEHMDDTLTTLKHVHGTLQINMCKLFKTNIGYVEKIIETRKLELYHTHTASLREALPATNMSGTMSFSGLCNAYCRSPDNFAHKVQCLHALLQSQSPEKFILNDDQLRAFRQLTDAILSSTVVVLLQLVLPYSAFTDASQ